MNIITPTMGNTDASRAQALLTYTPGTCIGAFWIPGGNGFSDYNVPAEWADIPLEGNTDDLSVSDKTAALALEMVGGRHIGADGHDSEDGMYLGFWLGAFASIQNPADISYCLEHTRVFELAAFLLPKQVEHSIPLCTQHNSFAAFRENMFPALEKDLARWPIAAFEAFCAHNFSKHGVPMYRRWLRRYRR
ncbi:MAG: hypothetical protein AAF528_04215 [Cyanobacteria bacterium P01_C01_bin.121]